MLLEQEERRFLAERSGLATAAYMSGAEVTLPSWEDRVAELDEALAREPEPITARDRQNSFWLQQLGVA